MTRWRPLPLAVTLLLVAATTGSVRADDDSPLNVTVAFGAGLNTAGAANHHIVPPQIRVRKGGVVHFVVAGPHQIFVYNPGTTPEDVAAFINPANIFINDLNNLKYRGINPEGFNPAGPPLDSFSDRRNRVESVSFAEAGQYLVICNIRPHFQGGMIAWVQVDEDD